MAFDPSTQGQEARPQPPPHAFGRPSGGGWPGGIQARAGRSLQRGGGGDGALRLAQALGWFSIGLGVAQLLAPRAVARLAGLADRGGLMRTMGMREMATGVGILAQRQPAPWLWGRVAGDVLDMALLGAALRPGNPARGRTAAALAAVAAITALDVRCGSQLRRERAAQPRVSATGRLRRATPHVIDVEKSITVNRPPEECYRFWRDFENLPRIMGHLESVRNLDERRSHWVVKAPAGMQVEWDAEVTSDEPERSIAWRSLANADVENHGSVRFEPGPAGRGTVVRVSLHYTPPGGTLGAAIARLFGEEPERQAREDLRRFKQVMETGEVPTNRGQPSGRRSLLARTTAEGRYS